MSVLRCRISAHSAGTSRTTRIAGCCARDVDQAHPFRVPVVRSCWRVDRKGAIRNLTLVSEALVDPPPGHALVAVRAIGLNFADVFACLGLYSATPKGSFIPGLEFSGDIIHINATDSPDAAAAIHTPPEAIPATPKTLSVGDRVWGVTRFGAYASHIHLDLRYLHTFPDHWSYSEAAAYPVQTITAAYGLLNMGALRPDQAVLLHSAAGGVGLQALQILSRYGAAVLGTVGRPGKLPQLREQAAKGSKAAACEFVVRGSAAGFEDQLEGFLRRHGRDGFDIVFDSVQGPFFQPGFRQLAPCGRYVVFGAASLTPAPGSSLDLSWRLLSPANLIAVVKLVVGYLLRPRVDPLQLPGLNKSVMGFNLIWLYSKQELFQEIVEQLEALGLDAPVVGRSFGFDQLPAALEYLQSGSSFGKVVVTLPGGQE